VCVGCQNRTGIGARSRDLESGKLYGLLNARPARRGCCYTQPMLRTTTEIINQAISENRTGEMLFHGFAVAFVLTGIAVIVWSLIEKSPLALAVGAAESSLFWPAINVTRRTRRENVILRMLEVPLSKARTADEAARMLAEVFAQSYRDASTRAPIQTAKE